LARRIALDLGLTLPAAADVALVTPDPDTYSRLVDAYLSGAAAGRAVAALHRRMWHLDAAKLSDLDTLAATDSTLAAALTDQTRSELIDAPGLFMRLALDGHLPFDQLFSQSYTILPADLVSLLGRSDGGVVWPGEPYHYAGFQDGRPAAGILAGDALLAAFPGDEGHASVQRTRLILNEISCLHTDGANAHLYYDLSPNELAGDLDALALQKPTCAGCHRVFDNPATAWDGLATGSTFADWLAYSAPATPPAAMYSGQPFTGLDGLGALVGADPRTYRCEVEKLYATILQRPLDAADGVAVATALHAFENGGLSLAPVLRSLYTNPEYTVSVIGPKLKGKVLRHSSGVRLLGLAQWRGVLESLLPGGITFPLPTALDPGSEQLVGDDQALPSGTYWHEVNRVAREAATAIVRGELADGTLASSRRLLRDLPDGSGATADQATVERQIKDVWKRLMGEDLLDANPTWQGLKDLWAAANPTASSDDFRRAWRTMLVAILTDPSFITY